MGLIPEATIVFLASFFCVLLLGVQSKLMRDDRWALCFFISWLIMLSQTALTWSIANNHLGMYRYLFVAGWGSSLGIVSAHFVYLWYDQLFKE